LGKNLRQKAFYRSIVPRAEKNAHFLGTIPEPSRKKMTSSKSQLLDDDFYFVIVTEKIVIMTRK